MENVYFTFEEKLKYFLVPPKLYIVYKLLKEKLYGEKEFALLEYLVDPERNSIDVGANKGVYTAKLSKLSKTVFAFEPNPKMHQFLQKSAPKNTKIFNFALSNETRTDFLRIPKGEKGLSNQGGSLSHRKVVDNYIQVEVQCKRLDDMNLKDIGFIKIDVEGFEQEVMEGGRETILRDRPTLLVEIEECHNKKPIKEMLDWVQSFGYRGYALFEGNILKSLDFFDSNYHHNVARETNRARYIFNFIFLPMARP